MPGTREEIINAHKRWISFLPDENALSINLEDLQERLKQALIKEKEMRVKTAEKFARRYVISVRKNVKLIRAEKAYSQKRIAELETF